MAKKKAYKSRRTSKKPKYSASERKAYHVGYGQGLANKACQYDVFLSFDRKSKKLGDSFMNGVNAGAKDREQRDRDDAKIHRG